MRLELEFDEGNIFKANKAWLIDFRDRGVFRGEMAFASDDEHSLQEMRFIVYGRLHLRYIYVAFTIRVSNGQMVVRLISVRYAREKEIRWLDEKTSK